MQHKQAERQLYLWSVHLINRRIAASIILHTCCAWDKKPPDFYLEKNDEFVSFRQRISLGESTVAIWKTGISKTIVNRKQQYGGGHLNRKYLYFRKYDICHRNVNGKRGFSTTLSEKKVSMVDENNDRQPEMAPETGNIYSTYKEWISVQFLRSIRNDIAKSWCGVRKKSPQWSFCPLISNFF